MSTRDFLFEALKNKRAVTFSIEKWVERNVTIVEVQDDDVCNKSFVYKTSKGDRYSSFENNITIRLTDEI